MEAASESTDGYPSSRRGVSPGLTTGILGAGTFELSLCGLIPAWAAVTIGTVVVIGATISKVGPSLAEVVIALRMPRERITPEIFEHLRNHSPHRDP